VGWTIVHRRRGRKFEQKEAKVTKGVRSGLTGNFIPEFLALRSRLEAGTIAASIEGGEEDLNRRKQR
jgi:hypothetical protein